MRVVHLASSLLPTVPTVPRVGTIIARICTLQWRLVRGWADLGKVPASSTTVPVSSRHILGRCSVGPGPSISRYGGQVGGGAVGLRGPGAGRGRRQQHLPQQHMQQVHQVTQH